MNSLVKDKQSVETFDLYLRDQMDPAARTAFEDKLLHDGGLRRQLEQYRILMNALRKANDAEFRTRFKQLAVNLDTKESIGSMVTVGSRFVVVGFLSVFLFAALVAVVMFTS
jgi:hypothetical protein